MRRFNFTKAKRRHRHTELLLQNHSLVQGNCQRIRSKYSFNRNNYSTFFKPFTIIHVSGGRAVARTILGWPSATLVKTPPSIHSSVNQWLIGSTVSRTKLVIIGRGRVWLINFKVELSLKYLSSDRIKKFHRKKRN